jgi:hypothetical protein
MADTVIKAPEGFCQKHPTEKLIVITKDGPRKGRKAPIPHKPVKKRLGDLGNHVLILNFDACADEDLWDDLHDEAKEEFRSPEMQALHLIRVMLWGKEGGE